MNMDKYSNQKYGFEIILPTGWSKTPGISRIPILLSNIVNNADILEEFTDNSGQFINITVEEMRPEIPPDITEMIFSITAIERQYANVETGRMEIGGREHTWAKYQINQSIWSKKYLIVLNGYGYAFTASSPSDSFSTSTEETWDSFVKSFKLTVPISQEVIMINSSIQAQKMIQSLRDDAWRELEKRRHSIGY